MNFEKDRARWLLDSYVWLNKVLPKKENFSSGWIALPNNEHFPFKNTLDHAYAVAVFQRIMEFMEITDWPCELHNEYDDEKAFMDAYSSSGILGETQTSGAAGTFRVEEDNTVIVTYSHEKLKDPVSLAATLAHELCHYLVATIKEEPPTGWDDLEYLTDLTAIKEGFGIFLSRSSFQFQQWGDALTTGWGYSRQGYLSESEISFALALYAKLNDVDEDSIASNLKANARECFFLAMDDLAELDDWVGQLKESNQVGEGDSDS